jgi:hypothetical protein
MEEGYIKIGQKQLQRWRVMEIVDIGKITSKEAGEKTGMFYR